MRHTKNYWLRYVWYLEPSQKHIYDENCIVDDEDDQVCEQMVSMSSVAVASDRLIVTFMGTPPNCATGYRWDTVSQIMLLMGKMIMIVVVVRSLFSQNFSKRGGTFLHIYAKHQRTALKF